MAKNWYPIIDKDKCTKCLSCVNFCKHDVYSSTDEEGFPLVKNPDNCVEFCRGCQKICPAEAITYFGDKK
ncbi:MAG: ferredoxin family protein [Tepidanaerobacteraceae bacterium]|jgi:NAD-dependent dihydropyrimidine dehydrogenase PreA subunit|nr:ferredoxin family protein [Tepidanaerobacteraceae bacterium]